MCVDVGAAGGAARWPRSALDGARCPRIGLHKCALRGDSSHKSSRPLLLLLLCVSLT